MLHPLFLFFPSQYLPKQQQQLIFFPYAFVTTFMGSHWCLEESPRMVGLRVTCSVLEMHRQSGSSWRGEIQGHSTFCLLGSWEGAPGLCEDSRWFCGCSCAEQLTRGSSIPQSLGDKGLWISSCR